MSMPNTYDTILVLAGEDPLEQPRSRAAFDLFRKGYAGSVFVTGGYGGFVTQPLGETDGERMYRALLDAGMPEKQLYLDDQSLETLGNFSFPATHPQKNNPRLTDLDSILLVTEESHMGRARQCAHRVLAQDTVVCNPVPGLVVPGFETQIYNYALQHALKDISADPEAIQQFLKTEHPFYQDGWFDLSPLKRGMRIASASAKWLLR